MSFNLVSSLWGCRVRFWGPLVLAALILILMIIPAEYWRHPVDDAAYQGFDPYLIYLDRKGGAPSSGLVDVTPKDLVLTALPNSRPTVTLATTPLARLKTEMHVRIVDGGPGTVPFRLGVWSPNTRSGQFLVFGPPPSNLVTFERIVNGVVGPTLVPGIIAKSSVLGPYVEGVSYRTTISFDKTAGIMHFRVRGIGESPPSGGRVLRMVGRGHPNYTSFANSGWVQVTHGELYSFGGFVKHLGGFGTFGFVVEWINQDHVRVGTSEEWRDIAELRAWTGKKFGAIAPRDATSARLIVGTGPGVEVLFADLFFSARSDPKDNLLLNGDFSAGERGWQLHPSNPARLEILDATQVRYDRSITTADAPDLFRELRLAVTGNGFSESGTSTAVISNFHLILPHQRWLVVKIDDSRVRALLLVFLLCAALLSATALTRLARLNGWLASEGVKAKMEGISDAVRTRFGIIAVSAAAVGVYVIFNLMLFNAGSLNYDLKTATVWLHVIPRYGLSALYHLPAVVGPADSWGGVPFQEATFPYGPFMGALFFAVSWLHKLLYGLPAPLSQEAFALAYTVKATTLLFTIADAGLIYLILRAFDVAPKRGVLGAGMFLFNPAVIFVGSVWGQTQSISLFFVLASIWMGAINRATGAWVFLALGALTRQQLLIPSILIGLYLIKKFNYRQTIEGISWGVLVSFLFIAPLVMRLAPSLPIDLFRNAFDMHILGEDSARNTTVSLSALSIWPLVTQRIAGQEGLGRVFYSGKELLIGHFTYGQVGNVLFLAVFLTSMLALISMRRGDRNGHIPILALGTLGLFLLKTGFAAFHMIPALALVTIGGQIFGRLGHYLAVTVLSTTILIATYGVAGFWMTLHPWWNVGLFSPEHLVTQAFVKLIAADWFITVASLGNLAVLGWLSVVVFRQSLNRPLGHMSSGASRQKRSKGWRQRVVDWPRRETHGT